jgi:single-strand DNA-binding protein
MNQVILIGRLTRDPELSYTANTQTAMCRFTLAVDRPRRSDGNEAGADFIRITVWDRQAENCDRYLRKGSQVAVRGRIETGSYKNREGVTVYTTDVVADRFGGVEFLGSRNSNQGDQNQNSWNGGQSNVGYSHGGNGNSGYNNSGRGNDGYDQQPNYGNRSADFGGQNTGFGGEVNFGGQNSGFGGESDFGGQNTGNAPSGGVFDGFSDLPDTFQAAEDDIPF